MARKDFDKYFMQLESQYAQLQVVLADISAEVSSGMMEPERLEQLRATIAPVKDSYDMLRYVKYLLDMPAKKTKRKRYNQQCRNTLKAVAHKSATAVIGRNNDVLNGLSARN